MITYIQEILSWYILHGIFSLKLHYLLKILLSKELNSAEAFLLLYGLCSVSEIDYLQNLGRVELLHLNWICKCYTRALDDL